MSDDLSIEARVANAVENATGRAEHRLVELGLVAPKRTRAQKRQRMAGYRLPNDGAAGQNAEQIKAARRAKAKAKRKGRR